MPRRPTVPREIRPDIAEKPEVKTLEWHIRKFAQQQKEWQSNQVGEDSGVVNQTHTILPYTYPSIPPIDLNKPLPAHPVLRTKDNHNVSKVLSPRFSHRQHLSNAKQLLDGPEPLGSRSVHTHRASEVNPGSSSLNLSKNPHRNVHTYDRRGVEMKHVKQAQPASDLPASLVAGINMDKHAYRKQNNSEAGDRGILGVPLNVGDFRNTLPEELQPKGPPLRWESGPYAQIPVVYQKGWPVEENSDLVNFRPKGESEMKPSDRELLPSASARKECTDVLPKK